MFGAHSGSAALRPTAPERLVCSRTRADPRRKVIQDPPPRALARRLCGCEGVVQLQAASGAGPSQQTSTEVVQQRAPRSL